MAAKASGEAKEFNCPKCDAVVGRDGCFIEDQVETHSNEYGYLISARCKCGKALFFSLSAAQGGMR